MHARDSAAQGLHSLNAVITAQGSPPLDYDEVAGDGGAESMADVIANLMHLARQVGHDPQEVLDKGWLYFEGDDEEVEMAQPTPGAIGYHATPAVLAVGDTLRPGPHLHHVFATEDPKDAIGWGRKQAGDRPVHVYQVRMGDDAERGSVGDLYSTTAEVLSEVTNTL